MKIATYNSLFGKVSIATQDGKLVGVGFESSENLIEYQRKYKNYIIDDESPLSYIVDKVLDSINNGTDNKFNMFLFGTPFQKEVWKEVLNIPKGITCSYQEIANRIRKPKSVRAVANAVGANPIAVIVPCHRVIRSDGSLGGYRWGDNIKQKLLAREYLGQF